MKDLIIGVFLLCCSAQCIEAAGNGSWDREGFFLGFTLGPCKLFSEDLFYWGKSSEGVWGNFRFGAGITENFLILAEVGGLLIRQDARDVLNVEHFIVGGQYFVTEHAYAKLGFGIGSISEVPRRYYDFYDQGLVVAGGAGYEYRLGETFAISGSGEVRYLTSDQISGTTTVSLDLGFFWYF